MSGPWWTREAAPGTRPRLAAGVEGGPDRPRPAFESARPLLTRLLARRRDFTPEWTRRGDDAGIALVKLFGSQLQPLLDRLDRLPEKTFVEFLRLAGTEPRPGTAARALLVLTVARGAPGSVLVPRGFQVGATPADGSAGPVVFETESDLYAAPGTLAEIHLAEGRSVRAADEPSAEDPLRPFGDRPRAGAALLLGIDSAAAPGAFLSLGIGVAAPPGEPPPASAGSLTPTPLPPPPVLRWEALTGGGFEPAEVVADGTAGLGRSGVVELRVPRGWLPGRPAGVEGTASLYWLRLRLVHGALAAPPELSLLALNAVPALAAATVRDEVLEPVAGDERRWRLARTPVLSGTLALDVVEGSASGDLPLLAVGEPEEGDGDDGEELTGGIENGADDLVENGADADVRRWREVDDLAAYGADDRVYTLDAAGGIVTFGDGLHGARLPQGFRHVRAASYQAGGGRAGAVDAETVTTLLSSVPFVTAVTNPLPATGGGDAEPRRRTLERGPREIRARGRAVTPADYELLAPAAPGADVARAHAVPGHHPLLGNARVPGVVGVYVVPADRGEGPPTADQETLAAVAGYLAREVAPAGVEVVTAAVRYHRVRAELAAVLADPAADAGRAVRRLLAELDRYLDPLTGGDDGRGWPFGGAVRYRPLLRRLLSRVSEVAAIPRLNLVVDGRRRPACTDAPLSAHGLTWPEAHEVVLEEGT